MTRTAAPPPMKQIRILLADDRATCSASVKTSPRSEPSGATVASEVAGRANACSE